MGANFKINPQFISILAFIGLCLTTPLVQASLPNKDVMKAVVCMRNILGDKFAWDNFRPDKVTSLTNGEYFEIMCQYILEEDLRERIENNDDEDFNGSSIKACLEKTGDGGLFQKYVKLGQTLALPSADEILKQDDVPPQKPETQQISPALENLKLIPAPTDGKSEINDDLKESEDEISVSDTAIWHFIRGTCKTGRDLEPVELTELKNEEEEKGVMQCLRECTSNFLTRITILIDDAKKEAINSPDIKLSEKEEEILNNLPESSKKFKKDKFDSELDKATEAKLLSTNLISEMGKKYLINYDELYNNVITKYATVEPNTKEYPHLGYLDVNLYGMTKMYQTCALIGCSMTTNNIPLYNLIDAGADDDDSKVLIPFENDQEDVKKWMSEHKSEWQRFCRALMIEPDTSSEENSQQEENVD
ncbi:uncharacterized protein LOC135833962 [Planococcus citri]|uniref:uncharacterized protein LOC135833962 n=1 Tax=Planococcus citri TaxID=170843 RepID=UPI0031F781DD